MPNFWNKSKENVTEAQDYLRSTDSASRPAALLLSLFGFLAVFALVFSLFLGGKWLFNRVSNDQPTEDVALVEQNQTSESDETQIVSVDNTQGNEGAGMFTGTLTDSDLSRIAEQITVNGSATTTDNTIVASSSTEGGLPDVSALPRTGPADTAMLLVAVTVIAGAAHNVYARR